MLLGGKWLITGSHFGTTIYTPTVAYYEFSQTPYSGAMHNLEGKNYSMEVRKCFKTGNLPTRMHTHTNTHKRTYTRTPIHTYIYIYIIWGENKLDMSLSLFSQLRCVSTDNTGMHV